MIKEKILINFLTFFKTGFFHFHLYLLLGDKSKQKQKTIKLKKKIMKIKFII